MENNIEQITKQQTKQIAELQKTVSHLATIINMHEKKIRQIKTENFMLKSKLDGISNIINNHRVG